jgi:hypothetical protein
MVKPRRSVGLVLLITGRLLELRRHGHAGAARAEPLTRPRIARRMATSGRIFPTEHLTDRAHYRGFLGSAHLTTSC